MRLLLRPDESGSVAWRASLNRTIDQAVDIAGRLDAINAELVGATAQLRSLVEELLVEEHEGED